MRNFWKVLFVKLPQSFLSCRLAPSLFLFLISIFRGNNFIKGNGKEEKLNSFAFHLVKLFPLKILMKKRNRLGAGASLPILLLTSTIYQSNLLSYKVNFFLCQ